MTQENINNLIEILVIDDEFDYCEQIKTDGLSFGFNVNHYQNFEDGFYELENNLQYKALVLDGRCILNKNQEPGTGKTNFVFHSINRLHHIELEDNRYIPYCVNSYNPEEFSEGLEGITHVFKKKEQHADMFKYLKERIDSMMDTQLRHKYEEIFSFVGKYFGSEDEDLLLELLTNAEDKDNTTIITNLGIIRRLEEKLYDVVAEKFLKTDPEQFKRQRFNRTKGIIFHLKDKQLIPQYLYNFSMDLYNIPSKFGNHNPDPEIISNQHLPGYYTVLSLCHSLMELISWANELIIKSNQKTIQ